MTDTYLTPTLVDHPNQYYADLETLFFLQKIGVIDSKTVEKVQLGLALHYKQDPVYSWN